MTYKDFKPNKIVNVKVGTASLKINQRIIPDSAVANKYVAIYIPKGGKMKPCAKLNNGTGKPKGIVVHNTPWVQTSNPDLANQYSFATWPNCNMGGTMVHYYVHKTNIWQLLEEFERGWHATDGNTRRASHRAGETIGGNLDCIAIECIGENAAGSVVVGEETTAKLCAYLCDKHGLDPMVDVQTHNYFYAKKTCPAYIIGHWEKFLARVQYWYDQIQAAKVKPKYSINQTLLIKKGSVPATTSTGTVLKDKTTIAKYGRCNRVVAGAPYPYRIGAYYYKEADCSLYKKSIKKGAKLTLKNVKLYASSTSKTASKTISGTYYVYDAIILNNRIRICPTTKHVGATPTGANVTGYISKDDV